jgi:hypothetical protein
MSKRKRNSNKLISVLLCLIIVLVSLIYPYQQAQAILPLVIAGVVLAPEAIAAIGTLLVAGGVYAVNHESINKMAAACYDYASAYDKAMIMADINSMKIVGKGLMNVSQDTWDYLKTFEHDVMFAQSGSNTFSTDYQNFIYDGVCYTGSNDLSKAPEFNFDQSFFDLNSDLFGYKLTWTIEDYPNDATASLITWYHDGQYWWDNKYKKGSPVFKVKTYLNDLGKVRAFDILAFTNMQNYEDGSYLVASTNYSVDLSSEITSNDFSYNGDSAILNNPDYDILNNGNRQVYVPENMDDLIGKTASDVLSPPIDPYSPNWTGTFGDCASGAYTFEGTGTYTGVMDTTINGDWLGSWGKNDDGVTTWTGTYTDANGLTWSGTATKVVTDRSWWQTLLSPITAALTGIGTLVGGIYDLWQKFWEWLQSFWEKLTAVLTGALAPVLTQLGVMTQAITSIDDKIANKIADDATDTSGSMPPQFDLPDLFWLLLLMIIAFIKLVLRGLVYVMSMYNISADGSMLPDDVVAGIEFAKNQNIPYFNVSFWSIVQILSTLLFGLALIKTGKKFLLSLNSQSLINTYLEKFKGGGNDV